MPLPSFAAVSYSENLRSSLLKIIITNSFFGALYTILKKEELLSNVNRSRVYQVISDFPGIHYCDIMKRIKFPEGTFRYHLDILEREKLIMSYPDGRFRRYRLHASQEGKSAAEVLRDINRVDEVMRTRIVNLIREKEVISQKEICKLLGSSKQVVSYHIRNLEIDRLIRTEKHGLTKRCYYIGNDIGPGDTAPAKN